jgi:hypothetical protein
MRIILTFLFFIIGFVEYADGRTQIAISEINYNSDSLNSPGDWIELYNYTATSVDISNWKIMDSQPINAFTIPAGTVIQPNGRLVLAENFTKFDQRFPGVPRIGPLSFGLAGSGEQITLMDQNGIVKVQLTYDDSLPWSKCADGMGRTLEIINPQGNPNDPANWRCGCVMGSPNAPFSPCTSEVVIVSEINYNSDSVNNPGDWFELWNTSNTAVNISGWYMRDDNNNNVYQFPPNTILNPQARLVVFRDDVAFATMFPNVNNKVGPFSFGLSNSGDCIRLYDSQNKIKFTVCFTDKSPWPLEADGGGYTLELDTLFNNSKDVCSAASWFAGCKFGSPGKAFSSCNVGLQESPMLSGALALFPNPASSSVRIHSENGVPTVISLSDIQGRLIKILKPNVSDLEISLDSFPAGLYIVKAGYTEGAAIERLVIIR